MTGKDRRTLEKIDRYPSPNEIFALIQTGKGWPYRNALTADYHLKRDKALAALLYLLACRISEGIRIVRSQFKETDSEGHKHKDRLFVQGIKLSKVKKKGHSRKIEFRTEAYIDLKGPCEGLAKLVADYLNDPRTQEQLFIKSPTQASKYVSALIGIPAHWLRAFRENWLYQTWDHDIIAVANYVEVDPRTLTLYIRKGYAKYQKRKV